MHWFHNALECRGGAIVTLETTSTSSLEQLTTGTHTQMSPSLLRLNPHWQGVIASSLKSYPFRQTHCLSHGTFTHPLKVLYLKYDSKYIRWSDNCRIPSTSTSMPKTRVTSSAFVDSLTLSSFISSLHCPYHLSVKNAYNRTAIKWLNPISWYTLLNWEASSFIPSLLIGASFFCWIQPSSN